MADGNETRPDAGSPDKSPAPQPYGGYHASAERTAFHILDYVRILYKRRRSALMAFLLIFIIGLVNAYTSIPVYEATVRVLIDADNPNVISFKEVIAQDQAEAAYYQTQYNILQSRTLARKTLQALKTEGRSEGARASQQAAGSTWSVRQTITRALKGVTDPLRGVFAWRKASGKQASPDESAQESAAIDAFLGGLIIVPVKNSRLVDIKYQSPDPSFATRAANALARGYIEQNLEYKFLSSKEATDWLGKRLAEQRQQVETTELALQRYREQNDAVSLEERQNIVVQKLADLNAAVTRAKTQRIEKQALYTQLQSIQSNPVLLDTVPAILGNSFIQQLKVDLANLQRQYGQLSQNLGDKHPDIIKLKSAIQMAEARLQGEIGKVVQSIQTDYLAAQAQERGLVDALESQKQEALTLNRMGIDYGVLRRDAESSKQIYDSLIQRVKETGVSTELKTSNIRIVDTAEVPRAPIGPNTSRTLASALIGGLVLGIGLAFFFEYLDNRIKRPEEIKTHLGLPFLGLLPQISAKRLQNAAPLVNNSRLSDFLEAFSTIRTNILFSSPEDGCKSLTITSTAAGEGKTVVASNLALGFAQAGQRVLLVDADMRRPHVHEVFGLSQEPGLSNLIVGETKASDAVRKTSISRLWVLSAGRIPPNPVELLGSERFKTFLSTAGSHFDYIVIDTPPVMPVSDASVVAHITSGIVFVVGAEMISRTAAQAALEQLDSARGRFVGAVLNWVDLDGNGFYYSSTYSRSYKHYYQPSAEV